MMKFLMIFILLITGCRSLPSSSERSPANAPVSEEAALLRQFLNCRGQQGAEQVFQCASPLIVTDETHRRSLLTWLVMPIDVSQVRACSHADLDRTIGLQNMTENFICFDARKGALSITGIAYFQANKGGKLLSSIMDLSSF